MCVRKKGKGKNNEYEIAQSFFFVFVSVSLWSLDFFIRLLYDDLLFSECSENSSKFFFRLMKYVGHYDKLDSCSVLFFRIESDGTIPPERSQKKLN